MLPLDLPVNKVKEHGFLHLHIMLLVQYTEQDHSKEENDDIDVVLLFPAQHEV